MRITGPQDTYTLLKDYRGRRQEHFIVITLDASHNVIKRHVVTKGLVNRTIVHPREVLYHAVRDFAVALIVAHNHPSGSPYPSREDDAITERLSKAAGILGFHLLDHIIVTKDDYYSFRQNGFSLDAD
ncbi:MAG: DNA repair protein RadC [Treponema sp.]|jgi:DNA repair protein RadC|nr:DNA repair protein RadC [Treponema sp.]